MIRVSFALTLIVCAAFTWSGCSTNGKPMRGVASKKQASLVGFGEKGEQFGLSFVEFDERGDFLDFAQHGYTQEAIRKVASKGVLLVVYCHGWKNSSQSGDVVSFAAFLKRLAESEAIKAEGLSVHGVYLGWRGNLFRPYVDKKSDRFQEVTNAFKQPIVQDHQRALKYPVGVLENVTYWSRRRAAEHKVSGLPMARAVFTYASTAKGYGEKMDNRVVVIGHSFGALMLEQSLAHAMTGEITMEWWQASRKEDEPPKPSLPFDLVLFVNSAAPSIYAKELRDFLAADLSARRDYKMPAPDVPVIVSVTSTADKATGILHPLGNLLAPLQPSFKRKYDKGIFDTPGRRDIPSHKRPSAPTHTPVRQSKFYTRTPGHQKYLINHWLTPGDGKPPATDHASLMSTNLNSRRGDTTVFYTSMVDEKRPAREWKISRTPPPGETPVMDGELELAMKDGNYWIIQCDGNLMASHGDIWSKTAMEMYAGLFGAVEAKRIRAVKEAKALSEKRSPEKQEEIPNK